MSSIKTELSALREANLYRSLKDIESDQDCVVRAQGRSLINFSSNNYLGLANDTRLKAAAIAATEKFGTGSGASRLITGSMLLHHQLEEKLAQFKGAESAVVFNSGYQANIGVIASLMREGDVIYSDSLNHASIVDGCRLSKAKTQIYRHGEVGHLEELLKDHSPLPRGERVNTRRLIVTDSVFSMDGDAAPLKNLASLAEKYDCWLMVDEAHATGVFGPNGKGLVEATWPEGIPVFLKERLIQMGTLGKALGSFGAYVAGSRELTEFLINKARAFIYTTSLPPAVIAASLAAIEIVEKEPERRNKLWENVAHLNARLQKTVYREQQTSRLLFPITCNLSPIFPLIIGNSQKALTVSQKLFEKGFWVTAIRYPTVAQGTERLRLTLMTTHTKTQIDALVETLCECL